RRADRRARADEGRARRARPLPVRGVGVGAAGAALHRRRCAVTTTEDGCASSTMSVGAGEVAARAAEQLWQMDIIDPPIGSKHPRAAESLSVINSIIERNGWGANVSYKGNGPPQWCGMFAGWCWAAAGL